MSVAVSCNLADGVVLAVDSAVALRTAGEIIKIYENAEKLFPLGNRPIGMAVYGLAAIGSRSVGSYLREFATENPVVTDPTSTLADIAEAARSFLLAAYRREVAPAGQEALGVVMGGFSPGVQLSEVWQVIVPEHETPGSALLQRPPGDFGADGYALDAPIRRYVRGADPSLLGELVQFMARRSAPLSPTEQNEVSQIVDSYAYRIRANAMPMDDGVAYARFLVKLAINHYRFASRDALVGGRVRLGRVDYRKGAFEVVDSPRRYNRCR